MPLWYRLFYFFCMSLILSFFSYLLPLKSPTEAVNEEISRTFLPVQHPASFSLGPQPVFAVSVVMLGEMGYRFPVFPPQRRADQGSFACFCFETYFRHAELIHSISKKTSIFITFSPPNSKRELIIGYWRIPSFLFQALFMQQYLSRHLCYGNHGDKPNPRVAWLGATVKRPLRMYYRGLK